MVIFQIIIIHVIIKLGNFDQDPFIILFIPLINNKNILLFSPYFNIIGLKY